MTYDQWKTTPPEMDSGAEPPPCCPHHDKGGDPAGLCGDEQPGDQHSSTQWEGLADSGGPWPAVCPCCKTPGTFDTKCCDLTPF